MAEKGPNISRRLFCQWAAVNSLATFGAVPLRGDVRTVMELLAPQEYFNGINGLTHGWSGERGEDNELIHPLNEVYKDMPPIVFDMSKQSAIVQRIITHNTDMAIQVSLINPQSEGDRLIPALPFWTMVPRDVDRALYESLKQLPLSDVNLYEKPHLRDLFSDPKRFPEIAQDLHLPSVEEQIIFPERKTENGILPPPRALFPFPPHFNNFLFGDYFGYDHASAGNGVTGYFPVFIPNGINVPVTQIMRTENGLSFAHLPLDNMSQSPEFPITVPSSSLKKCPPVKNPLLFFFGLK